MPPRVALTLDRQQVPWLRIAPNVEQGGVRELVTEQTEQHDVDRRPLPAARSPFEVMQVRAVPAAGAAAPFVSLLHVRATRALLLRELAPASEAIDDARRGFRVEES